MIFSSDRQHLRQQICIAWAKHRSGKLLLPLEQMIVDVVQWHPEWHELLADEKATVKDFEGAGNPFFHIALHLGLREQLSTNRPAGIAALYQRAKVGADAHEVEHQMMRVLAAAFATAAEKGAFPDEREYLASLAESVKRC